MIPKKIKTPFNSCFNEFNLNWNAQKEEYDILFDKTINKFRVGVKREKD